MVQRLALRLLPLVALAASAAACSGSVSNSSTGGDIDGGCAPLPCPAPGWDPATCACRPATDASACDPKLQPGCVGVSCVGGAWVCPTDGGSAGSGGDGDACIPMPCPYPGWDPSTCSCKTPPDSGACDPKLQPGCVGVTCVGGTWICPDVATPVCDVDAGMIVSGYKTCGGDSDCLVARHTLDCCGTEQYVGIAAALASAFAACETAWDNSLPDCGCMAGPTTAEDGVPVSGPGDVTVACVGGACTTKAKVGECEDGFCRPMQASSCGGSAYVPLPSWSCTLDGGGPGYCCMPVSSCGSVGYCSHLASCHAGFVQTQMGCQIDGGPGSCCKKGP